jgi:hypothetical protein
MSSHMGQLKLKLLHYGQQMSLKGTVLRAVCFLKSQTFRRNILRASSGSKFMSNRKQQKKAVRFLLLQFLDDLDDRIWIKFILRP